MHLTLNTADVFGLKLCGSFNVSRDVAVGIVSDRLAKYRIAADRRLLDWLHSLSEAHLNVTHRADGQDRMDCVIADLIASRGDVQITCGACNSGVSVRDIRIEEKDFSSDVGGMRMGFAGDLYSCPENHGLLFVVTKLY